MNLDNAVNNALDDLELVGNPRFIELMAALYERVEAGELVEALDSIGHFVPADGFDTIEEVLK